MSYVVGSMQQKITTFTDLIAWKEAHKLVLSIYHATKSFPKEEMYALADQIKRAAVSISSNIAEGFSRKSSKEKVQFYYLAKGSLTEVQNQVLVAKDVKYISKETFHDIAEQTVLVSKLLVGLIKSARGQA